MIKTIFSKLLILLIFSISVFPANSQARKVITSASEIDYPPFCMVDADGEPYGFSVELMRAALAAVNRDVAFETGIWMKVRGLLEKGEIQALPLVGRTPEREDLFDFTFPYMSLHGAIVVRDDNTDISKLSDLTGKNVAVMAGDNAEEFLRREKRGISVITTATFEDALFELSSGLYDAVVIQRLAAIRLLQATGIENLKIINTPVEGFRQDFCFAVKDGDRETLALLNEGLSLVIADGTYRYLHSKWFAALEIPSDRRIIAGGDHNYPPFEFLDEDGHPAGFNVDLTKAIAEEMGIDIEIRLGPWPDMLSGLEEGKIDVLQGMFYSPLRDLKFDFSQAHTVIHNISVTRKGEGTPPESIEELEGKSIAVQNGDLMHEFAVTKGLEDQLTILDTQKDVLGELAAGKYDVALVARLSAIDLINQHGWQNLVLAKKPLLLSEYCYAVQNNRKPLLTQFSEGLKIIEESGEYRQIYEKWMGIYEEPDALRIIRHIAMGALPLLVLFLAAIAWTMTLRRLVAKKTAELQRSEEQFRSLIEGAPDGIFVHSDYLFSYLNMSACRLFGVDSPEELLGKSILDRLHPSTRDIAEQRIKNIYKTKISAPLLEQKYLDVKGNEVPVEVSAVPVRFEDKDGALVFVRNITERKEAEEAYQTADKMRVSLESQLQHAQKMESVGRLAGGVAHDFNNMLSVIIGYTELALDKTGPESPLHGDLKEIHQATMRSADLTRQLLAFARKQTISPKVIDLNATVENILKTLRRLIGEDIDLVWLPDSVLWQVKMDKSQVDQMLANLCVNARDAIGGVGKVTIETKNKAFDEAYCKDHKGFIPGDFVRLAVSDDGCGMDKKTLDLVFEPFFTTKETGKGTGLGLATVYGIVKQNNGFINVYSEPDKGTTFKIYIPRHEGVSEKSEKEEPLIIPHGTGETVLVVEDELLIIKLCKRMLKKLGYNVITANSPAEAINLAEKHDSNIQLLITDVVMPGMNGRDLAGKIQSIYPDIKILYMSGYTANVIAHRGILEDGVCFMQKPFSLEELAGKVREALS